MQTQVLNDREQQVAVVGLKMFLDHIQARPFKSDYTPANEFDIIKPEHSRAHVLTALHKLTGKPIAGFYAPTPAQALATLQDEVEGEAGEAPPASES